MKYIAFLLLGALIGIGAMIYHYTSPTSPIIPNQVSPQESSNAIVLSEKTIITRLENIRKLAVLAVHIDTVTELEDTEKYFTWESKTRIGAWVTNGLNDLAGKRYVKMQGSGVATVSIDLNQLSANTVDINGNTITFSGLRLTVDDIVIDDEKTGPIDLQQGILIRNTDFRIMDEGRTAVKTALTNKLCDGIVRKQASENAKSVLKDFVQFINPQLTEVIVEFSGFDCN